VCVFDISSGQRILPVCGHVGGVLSGHFSPDGKTLATGSSDGTLRLWDVHTAKEAKTLRSDRDSWFTDFAFSPDGQTLVESGYGNESRMRDVATGKLLRRFVEPKGSNSKVSFLPGGKALAVYSFTTGKKGIDQMRLSVWDVATARRIWTHGHRV